MWVRGGCGCTVRGAGARRERVQKFFVRVTECRAKAHELNQLKNCKTRGCTALELFASIALRTVGLQQLLHYDFTLSRRILNIVILNPVFMGKASFL